MPLRGEELRARLMAVFASEADDHLTAVARSLAALRRGLPRDDATQYVESAFRAVHTLKGAARSVSLRDVESQCQALEEVFGALKAERLELTTDLLADVEARLDEISSWLRSPPRAGGAVGRGEPRSPATSIRVGAEGLDRLQLRAEELLTAKLAIEERVKESHALAGLLERAREAAAERGAELRRGGGLREAASEARQLYERLARDHRGFVAAVDALHEEARRVRLVPARGLLEPFERMVGELSRAQGKQVEWRLEGAELEVDRKVLDTIKAPLLHLLRNAVDHGIETPARRAAAGKPTAGRVGVRVSPMEGRRIEVGVEDDGAGFDIAEVRAAAVRSRFVPAAEADALSDQAALQLALLSGVSTSPVVTDLSGHGLGMAIVRDAVEGLGGELAIETRAGAGSCVKLRLPANVATFRGLLVTAGEQPFLLPATGVDRVLRVRAADLDATGGRTLLRFEGRAMPTASLAAVLGRAETEPASDRARPCVVVSHAEERAALLVDEVSGEREVLVKELRPPLVRVRHVSGAGLLGNGELVLILRIGDVLQGIAESPRGADLASPTPAVPPPAILVVDDSITTRTMERTLLESAGYRVQVAVDGIDAWAALHAGDFDLVVSDVDMPRLDGFDLTARIRADPRLAELPVVLVTALESREDKEKGVEVGANAYVIKSGFDQSKLLEIIRRLV